MDQQKQKIQGSPSGSAGNAFADLAESSVKVPEVGSLIDRLNAAKTTLANSIRAKQLAEFERMRAREREEERERERHSGGCLCG